jgi:hypothetical protein
MMSNGLMLISTLLELLSIIALILILFKNSHELEAANKYIEYLNFRVDELRDESWKMRTRTNPYCSEDCEVCNGKEHNGSIDN